MLLMLQSMVQWTIDCGDEKVCLRYSERSATGAMSVRRRGLFIVSPGRIGKVAV